MKKLSLQKNTNESGVVLLEAIVAVGVLITIFTASIALYIGSVGGMRMTNDQLIANYLAQDGVEQLIAKRQYNYDKNLPWLTDISCPVGSPCALEYYNDSITLPLRSCASLGGCQLYLDANGVYSHDSTGTPTYFSRSVEITVSGVEARAVITVSWNEGSDILTLPITYILYDDPNYNMGACS